MTKIILDEKGRKVGSVSEQNGRTTYLGRQGELVARVHGGRTYDAKGAYKGNGDQGARLFGK